MLSIIFRLLDAKGETIQVVSSIPASLYIMIFLILVLLFIIVLLLMYFIYITVILQKNARKKTKQTIDYSENAKEIGIQQEENQTTIKPVLDELPLKKEIPQPAKNKKAYSKKANITLTSEKENSVKEDSRSIIAHIVLDTSRSYNQNAPIKFIKRNDDYSYLVLYSDNTIEIDQSCMKYNYSCQTISTYGFNKIYNLVDERNRSIVLEINKEYKILQVKEPAVIDKSFTLTEKGLLVLKKLKD